jgi:hypothetical protein
VLKRPGLPVTGSDTPAGVYVLVPGLQHDDELARERVDALVLVVLGGDDEREYVTALDDPAAGCVCDAVAGDLPPPIRNQRGVCGAFAGPGVAGELVAGRDAAEWAKNISASTKPATISPPDPLTFNRAAPKWDGDRRHQPESKFTFGG